MSIHFHKLRVKEVRRETDDCVSISFEIPPDLAASFLFQHGQNVTVKKEIAGEEIRRSYSICSAPHEGELRIAVKRVGGGAFSSFANDELKAGDELQLLPPTGTFTTSLNTARTKHYLALAAGSGITPVISIIKTILQAEAGSTFTLVYGNKSRASIIFFEELQALKNLYIDRFSIIYVLSREKTDIAINSGRINIEKLTELSSILPYAAYDDIFICGPEAMIFAVKEYLEQRNIDKRKIHFELFTTPGQKKSTAGVLPTKEVSTASKSKVTIKLDGRSMDFDLAFDEEAILDAALKQGADLPYACKGGVCCTCKAKLIEGQVDMDVHWGLEDDEIEQGYILTCQSHPKSDKVVVDFDIK
jgi:ring-1,2-phenylacetyl-CoA epoxidase subunit PaaE